MHAVLAASVRVRAWSGSRQLSSRAINHVIYMPNGNLMVTMLNRDEGGHDVAPMKASEPLQAITYNCVQGCINDRRSDSDKQDCLDICEGSTQTQYRASVHFTRRGDLWTIQERGCKKSGMY